MKNLAIVSNRGPFVFSEKVLNEAEESLKTGTPPGTTRFGEGGLVQAMSGLLKPGRWNPIWIGASMGDKDIDVSKGYYSDLFRRMHEEEYAPHFFPHIGITPDKRINFRYRDYNFQMRFVFFDTEHMHSYYNNFANGFLWPLLHLTREPLFYKVKREYPRPEFEKNDFLQYMSSGVTFANAVFDETRKNKRLIEEEDEDFVVWVQDYHLMQVADVYKSLLLEGGFSPEAQKRIHVGQFMHTPFFNIHDIQGLIREDKRKRLKAQRFDPFPESIESVLQRLTWGMLANDFIGFHTKEYCDNYLNALQEWFPVEIRQTEQFYEITHSNGITTVGAFPIGLDVDRVLSEVSEEKTLAYQLGEEDLYEKIQEDRRKGKTIFGGLERCDYTKGILERIKIFQYALGRLRSKGNLGKTEKRDARFYQITSPSRLANPAYQNLQRILKEEVAHTNKRLNGDGQSIVHLDEGLPPPQNYRILKEIEVMLVTPAEDGMNLVAFEYILSQKYKNPEDRGMLVLGNSGASRLLKDRGFGEKDGIIYIDSFKVKDAGIKAAEAMISGRRLSEELIRHVESECRVDDWAQKNIDAIMSSRKTG